MVKVEVFDPAMCCSTGVCGPSVDPALSRFAADLEWLAANGVAVERATLAQEPAKFVANPLVSGALAENGDGALPAIIVDGALVSSGEYPERNTLAQWAGVAVTADNAKDAKADNGCCGSTGCC
ncbi:arsenite efflux transporter metallochaperone ArsD [Demequina flava]|uniref:arsenite efflux transporter metallochaperone ArsD n=1 Tax=Demequina flava TaxID=1095025 RepID=UPI00078361E9|nr:arsenite efflux transporter metallochaperone ArsD [Demequina flava]